MILPRYDELDTDAFAKLLMSEDRKSWQDPERILNEIEVSAGTTVIDLACGPGYFTIPIAQRVTNVGKVYAVDYNSTMISHLVKNLRSSGVTDTVTILGEEITKTSVPSGVGDLVLFANVLHDVEDKKSFLTEVKRIANAECKIVDIDWHKRETEMGPPPELRLSEQDSRRILTENGLEIIRAINPGTHHYGFVCRKKL